MSDPHEPIRAMASAAGIHLPAAYFAFIDHLTKQATQRGSRTLGELRIGVGEYGWRPFGPSELQKPFSLNGRPPVPNARRTSEYAAMLRMTDEELGTDLASALTECGFDLDRLARGFTIGEDSNGEPIFVDPDTGSVFIYYHDGMDVGRWADSVDDLIARSREAAED